MPVVVFGSLNQDIVTHTNKFPSAGETVTGTSFETHLGGKGLNEAVAVAKLRAPSDNFKVKLVGSLGNTGSATDEILVKSFKDYLTSSGVSTDLIKVVKGTTTGTATIIVQDNSNGENRIIVVPGANAYTNPSLEDLTAIFKDSNNSELITSIENPEIPSHMHAHSTKPLNNEEMAKTTTVSSHQPSHIHSHGSISNLNHNESSDDGLVYKNGSLIHSWSASGIRLNDLTHTSSSASIHSHGTKPIDSMNSNSEMGKISRDFVVSQITGSNNDNSEIPSELHSHASHSKLSTLTYPSPKPSVIDLQNNAITLASKAPVNSSGTNLSTAANARIPSGVNLTAQQRLTNVSFSLGGSSAHSSNVHLTPSQSYLQMFNSNVPKRQHIVDDNSYIAILQNEIPNPHFIISNLKKSFSHVSIMYNPSPLPLTKNGFNNLLLDSLHNSNYIVLNEHELLLLVKNYHNDPDREPLTTLKNISNFDPPLSEAEIIKQHVNKLTKLRTIVTKPAIIVTLGEYGVLYSPTGAFTMAYVPAEEIPDDDIVDTTGAGDTFLGALATCIYRGEQLDNAIKFATKASAIAIQRKGAAESVPGYKEVERRGWIL